MPYDASLPYGVSPLTSVVFGEPNAVYHADTAHWSNSQITTFRSDGPAEFFRRHVARDTVSPSNGGMRRGTHVHLWAEIGYEAFAARLSLAPDEYTTAAGALSARAKPWLDTLPADAIPMTRQEADGLLAQCRAIEEEPVARALLERVEWREFSVRWTDDHGHMLRCRPDMATPEVWADLKSTREARPLDTWWKSARSYRYAQQAALYGLGARQCHWPPHSLHFIVTSSVPPYRCHVVTLPERWVQREHDALMRTLDEIERRRSLDCWLDDEHGRVVELRVPRSVIEEDY